MKKKSISKFSISFGIIIVFIILFLLKQMMEKSGFHIDEIYSYGLANSNYQPFPWEFDTWLDGEYYQNYVTVAENEMFDYGSVYYNQTQDVHPPLYYFILHTISSFFPGTFSKWIGLSLNLVIHILVFYVTYKLLSKITDNKWVSLSGAIFWILSKGAIDSLLFIRMYPLLTLIQVILLYVSLRFYKNRNKINLLYLFITISLGALTHYYFYIYAFFSTLVVCLVLLFEKNIREMLSFGLSALAGVISAVMFFPSVFTHVLDSNRGQEVLEGLENNLSNVGNLFFEFIHTDIFRGVSLTLLTIIGTIGLLIVLYKFFTAKSTFICKKISIYERLKKLLIIIVPTLIYIIIVQQVSHYQTPRYIFAIYPIIVIALFIILYDMLKIIFNKKKYVSLSVGIFALLFTFFGVFKQESDYKFEYITYMDEFVEEIDENNILVLMDEYWKISNYALDLRHFNAVYPVEIVDNPEENLPDEESISNLNNLYVLYNKNENLNSENVTNLIRTKYNFENFIEISETSTNILYEFK